MSNLLTLNGWSLSFDRNQLNFFHDEMADSKDLMGLRQSRPDWFFYWNGGYVYGLPIEQNAVPWGESLSVTTDDILGLRFLAARVVQEFPALMKRPAFRQRPFTFLGDKDAIAGVAQKLSLPLLVRNFAIRSKFELDTKIFEFVNDEPFLGIILGRRTSWSCEAGLTELQSAGVDLSNLCVVRRQTQVGQKRLVGRIGRVKGGVVELCESYDNLNSIAESEVWLEGSTQSFARCLRTLLGPIYRDFEEEIDAWEEETFAAPKFHALLNRVEQKISGADMDMGAIRARIGNRLTARNTQSYRTIVSVPSVECCFDSAKTRRNEVPWDGLNDHGPFSKDTFARKSPRIWVFYPDANQGVVESFIRQLNDGIVLPNRNGETQKSVYYKKLDLLLGLVNPHFQLKKIGAFNSPRTDLSSNYVKTIKDCLSSEPHLDVAAAIVIVPDGPTTTPAANNSYLQAKALLLMAGIPVQELRLPTIAKLPYQLQYVLRNIAISLYAKMGGIPWTIANDLNVHDELVIGMGTIETSDSRFIERQRFVGITTVFSGEGNYLLGNVSENCSYQDYPQVLYDSTLKVLREIKSRNGWQPNDVIRIIFHAKKPLKNVEVGDIIAACVDEFRDENIIEFAFLNIVEAHPFYLFDPRQSGIFQPATRTSKGALVPQRGTICQLGRFSRMVCLTGPRLMKHTAMPQPIMVHLHESSNYNDLDYLAEQVLKFTAMSWRSTNPAPEPVSIYYSELIAKMLSRLQGVKDWSPAMLDSKLRASRWFL